MHLVKLHVFRVSCLAVVWGIEVVYLGLDFLAGPGVELLELVAWAGWVFLPNGTVVQDYCLLSLHLDSSTISIASAHCK